MRQYNLKKFFVAAVLSVSLAVASSFAEERLEVIQDALDRYELDQQPPASDFSSINNIPPQMAVAVPFKFLLAQDTSKEIVDPNIFSESLLNDEMVPEELRRVLQDPDQIQKADLFPEDEGVKDEEEQNDPGLVEMPDAADESMTEEVLSGSVETAVIDYLQLKDMEIMDVLKLLSQKSGLNIIAGRNIKGTVSIYLGQQ